MGYEDMMKAQAEKAAQMADANFGRNAAVSGGMIGGSALSRGIGQDRPCMLMLSASLEQIEMLAAMTTDLANRIGGPVPALDQFAGSGVEASPSDLRSTAASIERAINRVEVNVSRAMSSL